MDLHSSKITISEPRPIIKQKRERVIPSRVDRSKAHGTLVLNNVYIGRNMEGIKKGEIKKLMVLETLPKPLNYGNGYHDFIPISHGGTFTLSRIVGTVPVEPDGSAHFELPAKRPLFFIALDEKNRSVKRMHSFLSVMPGEVLSCVGCHEDRVKTPTIAVGRVVSAMKRPPSKLKPVPGVPYTIDFPKHVQPILDKHCVKCHSTKKPGGRVILSGDRGPIYSYSYMTLTTTGLVSDGRNGSGNSKPRGVGDSASPLMKMLDGSHHKAKLSAAEIAMIRNWIHIGAPYPGTYAALYTGMLRNNTVTKEYRAAAKTAEMAFKKNCSKCHRTRMPAPERNSIAGNKNRKTYFWDSHMAFNLTDPARSPLLLAPLSVKAGGWGTCKARDKSPAQEQAAGKLFTDTKSADYQAMLKMATEAKVCLDKNKRWDMPGFKPHPYYVREMKRYGILSEKFDIDRDKIDAFQIDRRYWESFWYYPKGDGPKLFANKKMHRMLTSHGTNASWAKDLTKQQ
jgi:mono/diheme cytochrome c family protein